MHYLTLEYLAELTMSILALQKQRDPQLGYATDFLDVLERLCPILQGQPHLKIITNAGGMNPTSCAARARALLDRAGLAGLRIATVSGDDLLPHLDRLISPKKGQPFANNWQPASQRYRHLAGRWPILRGRVWSAAQRLSRQLDLPIADALQQGASLVITGRVADAALTVGPAAYTFGWELGRLGSPECRHRGRAPD